MNKSLRNTFFGGSAIYLIIGLAMILWPDASKQVICYALGGLLLLFGVIRVISYFSVNQRSEALRFDFVLGMALLILGLLFVLRPNMLLNIFGVVVGIAVTLDSIVKLQFALELRRLGSSAWVRALVLALVMLALGLVLLFNPFAASSALTIFTGICLVLDAIANIWFVTDIAKHLK